MFAQVVFQKGAAGLRLAARHIAPRQVAIPGGLAGLLQEFLAVPSRGATKRDIQTLRSGLNENLGGKTRPARGALAAEFRLGGDAALLVYNVHLKSNYGEAPRNQAQRGIALHQIAADAVAETFQNAIRTNATYTLVLGDTNVDPDNEAFAADPSLHALAGGYRDLWRGRPLAERITIPTRQAGPDGDPLLVFPPAAFDRIFASKNLGGGGPWRVGRPEAIQKGTDTANNLTPPGINGHVSDHHLAYVDLERTRP